MSEKSSEQIVYTSRTGSKYHSKGCRYLKSSSISIELKTALKIYSPCSVCNPPYKLINPDELRINLGNISSNSTLNETKNISSSQSKIKANGDNSAFSAYSLIDSKIEKYDNSFLTKDNIIAINKIIDEKFYLKEKFFDDEISKIKRIDDCQNLKISELNIHIEKLEKNIDVIKSQNYILSQKCEEISAKNIKLLSDFSILENNFCEKLRTEDQYLKEIKKLENIIVEKENTNKIIESKIEKIENFLNFQLKINGFNKEKLNFLLENSDFIKLERELKTINNTFSDNLIKVKKDIEKNFNQSLFETFSKFENDFEKIKVDLRRKEYVILDANSFEENIKNYNCDQEKEKNLINFEKRIEKPGEINIQKKQFIELQDNNIVKIGNLFAFDYLNHVDLKNNNLSLNIPKPSSSLISKGLIYRFFKGLE